MELLVKSKKFCRLDEACPELVEGTKRTQQVIVSMGSLRLTHPTRLKLQIGDLDSIKAITYDCLFFKIGQFWTKSISL